MKQITRHRRASRVVRLGHGIARVELTQGLSAIIDAADIDLVKDHKWHAVRSRNTYYARRNLKGSEMIGKRKGASVTMHQVILNATGWEDGVTVDHINRNGLDNRRKNLRPADRTIQKLNESKRKDNTSGVSGVHLRPDGTWQARIAVRGKRYSLGHFDDYANAARCQQCVRNIIASVLADD